MSARTPNIDPSHPLVCLTIRMLKRGSQAAAFSGSAAWTLLRRKDSVGRGARIGTTLLGLMGADLIFGGYILMGTGLVIDYSKPGSRYTHKTHQLIPPCTDPDMSAAANEIFHQACQKTADDIRAAAALWKKTMASIQHGDTKWAEKDVPAYIGEELALRAAAVESDMGRLQFSDGTFTGLYQFSITKAGSLFFEQKRYFLKVLNAARSDIPVLTKLKAREIKLKELESPSVFYDTTVQVFLKLTSAYIADQTLTKDSPVYSSLDASNKLAYGYLYHLSPAIARMMAHNPDCGSGMYSYTHKVNGIRRHISRADFSNNSGVLQINGYANPSETVSRFDALTTESVKIYAPDVPLTPAQPAYVPGKYGVMHWLYGKVGAGCTYNIDG